MAGAALRCHGNPLARVLIEDARSGSPENGEPDLVRCVGKPRCVGLALLAAECVAFVADE